MHIDFRKLNFTFTKKPILVGGMAMQYYGLRESGEDIDLLADERDVVSLIKQYPDKVKDLYADLGVCPFNFEIWRSIRLFKYKDLLEGAIEEDEYCVISLEKLLLMQALVISEDKHLQDTKLIAKRINDDQYKSFDKECEQVKDLLKDMPEITYMEKTGSDR